MRVSSASRSIGRGLARVEPAGATLVVYAAKHGQVAMDGDGTNSPFVSSFLRRMTVPGVEIGKLFRLVRDDVLEATRGKQEPFTYGSLPGREDFYFFPVSENAGVRPVAAKAKQRRLVWPLHHWLHRAAYRAGTKGSVFAKSARNAVPLSRYMSMDIAGNHFFYLASAAGAIVYQPTRARCQRTGWRLHFERFLGLG